MAPKKRLELEPLQGADALPEGAEARYDRSARRLELVDARGQSHREFSHETGVVQVDRTGERELLARDASEAAARAARTREQLERDGEILRNLKAERGTGSFLPLLEPAVSLFLKGMIAYLGARALYQLFCLALGRAAPELLTLLLMVAVAAVVVSLPAILDKLPVLPLRLLRIGARLAYAVTLLGFGFGGIWRLVNLFRHPPPQPRYAWFGFGHHLGAVVVSVAMIYGAIYLLRWALRKRRGLLEALEDPGHALYQSLPVLKNRGLLRLALYALEGAMVTGAVFVLSILGLRADPMLLFSVIWSHPAFLLVYLYLFLAYLLFRANFYPQN